VRVNRVLGTNGRRKRAHPDGLFFARFSFPERLDISNSFEESYRPGGSGALRTTRLRRWRGPLKLSFHPPRIGGDAAAIRLGEYHPVFNPTGVPPPFLFLEV
jgi:hypothetical protein